MNGPVTVPRGTACSSGDGRTRVERRWRWQCIHRRRISNCNKAGRAHAEIDISDRGRPIPVRVYHNM